jgi:hypothetical protein
LLALPWNVLLVYLSMFHRSIKQTYGIGLSKIITIDVIIIALIWGAAIMYEIFNSFLLRTIAVLDWILFLAS